MMVSFDTNIYPTLSTTKNFAPRLMSCARGNVTSVALSFTQPADTLTGIALGTLIHNAVFVLRLQAEQRLAALVASERKDRNQQPTLALGLEQALPRIHAQDDRLQEPFGPVRGDQGAVAGSPKDGVECVVIDLAENLVVTAHDGAEDGLGLAFVGKFWRFAAPDQRQPFAWQRQFWPDRNAGEKAVKDRTASCSSVASGRNGPAITVADLVS
jgi:hypothetical protein